jgi:hypothetical protein
VTSPTINDPQDLWISPARFRLATSGVDGGEVDYGFFWGTRENQRVSLRLHGTGSAGVLYAYDALWDEYRILATDIARREAAAAVAEVAEILGTQGISVDVLAQTVQDRLSRAQPARMPAAGIEVGP